MKRTLELALQCAAPQEALHALDIYSQATVRLAHALRLSRQLKQSQQEDLMSILQKAIQGVLAETGRGAKSHKSLPPKSKQHLMLKMQKRHKSLPPQI